jgi:hypothetical protein
MKLMFLRNILIERNVEFFSTFKSITAVVLSPLIIRIPPNRHLSVNVTFCIPPRAPHSPPGVRIPQAENRFITGFEDISQDKNAKLLTHKTPFRQISGLLHDYIVNNLLNKINV